MLGGRIGRLGHTKPRLKEFVLKDIFTDLDLKQPDRDLKVSDEPEGGSALKGPNTSPGLGGPGRMGLEAGIKHIFQKSAAGLRPLFLGLNIEDFVEFKTSF